MHKKSRIDFVDLRSQYADLEDQIFDLVHRVLASSSFVGGEILDDFESSLAEYAGVEYAIGCSDGTAALEFALLGMGIRKGDLVIVPANSYIASANAVVHAGGTPVLIDCDPKTFLVDLNMVEDVLKRSKVRFVMPVHLYGNPCPMDQVNELAARYGARIIEDNAQALGADYLCAKTGSFGTAAGVSFYPAKNLGAFGQGGAVLTNDRSVAEASRMYREQGQSDTKYRHEVVGYNGRLHTLQAGILNILLRKLDQFNTARQASALEYAKRLPDDRIQKATDGGSHVYHLFEYRCESTEERDELARRFFDSGIGFGFHYPVPIHKQQAYAQYNDLCLPVSERLSETLISLPMHPSLSKESVHQVCEVLST